jgi:hypothetical protein
MQPQEFDQIVAYWRRDLGLYILIPQGRELLVCRDSLGYYRVTGFFLAESVPDSLAWSSEVFPAELGWVDVTPPLIQGKALLKSQIAYKSDWYDSETEVARENNSVHKLFKTASKPVRKTLRYPVWARNVAYNTPWEACRDIGYSSGAAEWETSGGELRQNAVKNILFSVSPNPTPEQPPSGPCQE